MNKYEIIKTPQMDYSALVILYTSDSLFFFVNELIEDLEAKNISGNVLIDQIMHSGNNDERFILLRLNEKKENYKYIPISKKSEYRILSCSHLRKKDIINNSILSSTQSKMIKKGLVI